MTVDSFIWQKDFYDVECKIVGYKGNKPVLRNIDTRNSKWKINENYILKILDYSSIFNKKDEKIKLSSQDIESLYKARDIILLTHEFPDLPTLARKVAINEFKLKFGTWLNSVADKQANALLPAPLATCVMISAALAFTKALLACPVA